MTAIYLLLLATSCTGSNPIDTSSVGDADTDTDADSDADADVTFDIVLPMSGATVTVDDENVPCDASNVCAAIVDGDGTFDVIVEHATYYFIPKEVTVTNGVPDAAQVTYATGGCASDSAWAGTSWCDDWVMSEYQVTIQAECCDEQNRCYNTVTGHADLDGDGVEEAVLDIYGDGAYAGTSWNASGLVMTSYYGLIMNGYGSVESDLSVITIWYGSGPSQKIFTCN